VIQTEQLLQDLTEPQRQAATHVDGPLLIIAGAGSGKTRVITRRVAYLISLGIPASSILAITFTNKAAGEMKQRVSAVCERPLRDFGRLEQPWPIICTFHSLCLRILRHYADRIGLPANFSIYDAADQTRLIKEAIKELGLDTANWPASTIHGTISNAKNQLLTPEAFARQAGDFYQRTAASIYTKYQELLKQNNALDYDDLLLRVPLMLRQHPDILAELQERFQYILIDEYQDTNHAQYVVAHALAIKHRNICVVGDPDQSIYAWRGADIRNILDFEKDYPNATIVKLEQNYRSTKTILHLASTLIANNTERKEKGLWTENPQGEKATLFVCDDEHQEAAAITRRLKELHEQDGCEWSSMAIFYRMNSLSRVMEDALRKAGIPYYIARGVEFYNRKEIKDILAYLRVIANPDDEVSLTRIVNTPARGISPATVRQLQTAAVGNGLTPWQAMQQVERAGLASRATASVQKFVALVQSWQRMAEKSAVGSANSIQALMEDIVRRSGLEAHLRKIGDKEKDELANVGELITSAAEFDREQPEGTLDEYLSAISLVSDADQIKDGGGAVTLMTLHTAKGLEFPVVSIIGMEEGILPHSRARDSQHELEEERRLCFVGITRAEQRLLLSRARYRMIRGLRERTIASPFLHELPAEAIETVDLTDASGFDRPEPQPAGNFRRGQMVRHPAFGIGRITDIANMGAQTRAVIEFNQAGRKTLILQYARLEPVG
jgi:DNA helicase II / ATP-dependent DNA helicase PcrA